MREDDILPPRIIMTVSASRIKIQLDILVTVILETVNQAAVLTHCTKTKLPFWSVDDNLNGRFGYRVEAVLLTNRIKTVPTC